ncbi:putative phage-related protein [Pectobacterium atrosepticum]|uniref:phage virion morphogenesis protein n=1 Tax=Pectobacterium atrosepticum TaxID=29471 RepID=UPI0004E85418|nr:phage virion morphogenesis protein [Pectobacterium atrosepticum]AIK14259.1 putative phage-related protein [Pectobacterium atrosepticum]ATY91686.1 phage virion morphogenesis protein [Pectobacterium atrosepticum]KFX13254.1 phage morphogeneis protein [Pectobacterium atrosepticum]KMK81979.1 putative virion morphogenesis protein [Pectobacterium atrosepticum ICMP 1526]QXE15254.1 phage virion morphogenesis protein [Pectobacterium atrosepticum]
MYEIKYDITDFERGLGELISRIEHRQPLMREMAAAMHDAVEENFAQQGRPAWAGWSPRYAKKRQGGKILQKSGRLAASINEYSDNDSATVGTNVVYARIHQEGGTINMPARSQRAYYKQNKDGSVGNRFVKKSKSNFSQWNTMGEYRITIPARPFLHLTESDVEGMENTAAEYLKRVIDG